MLSTVEHIHSGDRYRLKDREKARVFQELAMNAPCSRKSIAERTGIRPTTVSRAVGELVADGLVRTVARVGEERPGRPELLLEVEPNRLIAVSMYVQARELRTAVINLLEQPLHEHVEQLSPDVDNRAFLSACERSFRAVRDAIPLESEVIGVSVSLIGTVATRRNSWISAARWRQIRDLDFSLLSRRLKLPVVINRIQDAELGYVVQKTPGYRDRNVLFVHWGFGIGAAYAHGGQVMGSTIGRFCEIGHTRLTPEHSKECQCGARGCLETEAALWAIRGEIADVIPGSLTDERELGRTMRELDIADHPAIERATRYFIQALFNLHQLLYPDAIVIVGPFTENEEVFRRVTSYFQRELPLYARDHVELRAIPGGFQGCMSGSVYRFFNDRLRELLRLNARHN